MSSEEFSLGLSVCIKLGRASTKPPRREAPPLGAAGSILSNESYGSGHIVPLLVHEVKYNIKIFFEINREARAVLGMHMIQGQFLRMKERLTLEELWDRTLLMRT